MRKIPKTGLLLWMILAALFFLSSSGVSEAAAIDRKLYSELIKFPTDKKIIEVHGVPCLKIYLPKGHSISRFCRSVRYFDRDYYFYRQQIALMNRLEPMAVVDAPDDLSTEVEFIYVPLNYSTRPKLLPEHITGISQLPKFILIDIGKQCLGLYEHGKLAHLFPISSGKHGTPAKKFVLMSKEKDHYSTKYDNAWMPYSMRLFGNYFLHGGILPSYAASHGCVRLIYENAVFVYNWADVGTPGEVTNRTVIEQKNLPAMVRSEEPDIKVLYY